jgi:hypothetical protein
MPANPFPVLDVSGWDVVADETSGAEEKYWLQEPGTNLRWLFKDLLGVTGNSTGSPVTHFGKQVRKERLARGWSIHEMSARTGIAAGHLSSIENGKRPPTENLANKLDAMFPRLCPVPACDQA